MSLLEKPKDRAPVVALVEWSWGGHSHTYYKHFLRALIDCGATALPVVSERSAIADIIESEQAAEGEHPGSLIAPPLEFVPSRPLPIRPRSLKTSMRLISTFGRLRWMLRQWERRSRRRVDLIFFPCIWDDLFASGTVVSIMLRRPWSGLYLQGRAFHSVAPAAESRRRKLARKMFGTRGLLALGVLEPRMVSWLNEALPRLPVRIFPDVLEPDASASDGRRGPLVESIARFADGRPIVALLGALQPSKGIELFLRAACDDRTSAFAFVMAGELEWPLFDRDTRQRVQELMKQAKHLHVIPARLTEAEFNAVFRQADVVFAAYKDFPYSSNVQMKAAQFHKPMIVTDGTLMAERARTYELGESIPQDDLETLVHALPRLANPSNAEQPSDARTRLHEELVAANSYPAVKKAIQWVLDVAAAKTAVRQSSYRTAEGAVR